MRRGLSTCVPRASGNWHHVKWRLQLLRSIVFLAAMSFLDVRDLWYKLTWIGPYDAYAFDAGSRGTLLPSPLPLSMELLPPPFSPLATPLSSGWPSYLSRCQNLTAFCAPQSTFFLNAMGRSCDVSVVNETKVIDRLVMTSNVRVDSMAWAACQLLYGNRRPSICQEAIVGNFLQRYGFSAKPIDVEWMAHVGSAAETELLRFLELIAMSHPRERIICTGGFAYTKPGPYKPTIFGCASANVFRAEFVGVFATTFHELAFDKAWLTAIDVITLVDISYKIRQNTINVFDMDEQTIPQGGGGVLLSVTETTANNFVSSGLFYVLMVVLDALLLAAQMYTAMELVTQWIMPAMRKRDEDDYEQETTQQLASGEGPRINGSSEGPLSTRRAPGTRTGQVSIAAAAQMEAAFSQQEYTSFLSSSLYRHPVFVLFTVVSQFISWGIIIPNSVVWTWSLSNYSKVMAFFSSLRLWALILVGVNGVWDLCVLGSEKYAYVFARATFVTTFEIMAVGAVCAFAEKDAVMAISETKFGIEHQRINDVVSFPGFVAHGNTFNGDLDVSPNSSAMLLRVMYLPLLKIVLYSVVGVFGWLVVKLYLIKIAKSATVVRSIDRVRRTVGLTTTTAGGGTGGGADVGNADLRRKQLLNSAHTLDPRGRVYQRVALERLVDIPMRARSLVRPTLSMQKTVSGGDVLLRPAVHLDFGLFVHDRTVSARRGFESTVRTVLNLPAMVVNNAASRKSQTITVTALQPDLSEFLAHDNDEMSDRGANTTNRIHAGLVASGPAVKRENRLATE